MTALFITGIGTGVGKTVVTAGLAGWLASAGQPVCVYKPVQTGSEPGQPEDAGHVRRWCGEGVATHTSYTFPEPAAPLVADLEREIKISRLLEDFKTLRKQHPNILVEGAGGLRVPLTPDDEMVDLIRTFQIPVLLVARPYLGAINHTLLSVECLVRRRIEVAGVVVSGSPEHARDKATATFTTMLERFMEVPLLGTLPEFELREGCFMPGSSALDAFDKLAMAMAG